MLFATIFLLCNENQTIDLFHDLDSPFNIIILFELNPDLNICIIKK